MSTRAYQSNNWSRSDLSRFASSWQIEASIISWTPCRSVDRQADGKTTMSGRSSNPGLSYIHQAPTTGDHHHATRVEVHGNSGNIDTRPTINTASQKRHKYGIEALVIRPTSSGCSQRVCKITRKSQTVSRFFSLPCK